MGQIATSSGVSETLWASDINFDGICLEVYTPEGEHWFDVSVPETGAMTVNTFTREVPAEVIAAAVELARQR